MPVKLKIRESLSVSGVGKVDRAACVVHDVRVCGTVSRNGKRYPSATLKEAAKLYEGTRVFFDHPDGESNVRRFRERFGRLVNVRPADDGGLTADLKYNPKHADAESFLWLAENDPAGMGLSHNAEGQGIREASGDVLVERITKVHSVDIVDGPATNISLYEQESDMPDPVTDPMAGATDPMAGATDSGDQDIDAKLSALCGDIAAHPDWDKATKIAKIKALVNLLEDKGADDKQGDKADDKEPSDDEMMEQLGAFKSPAVKKARRKLLREQLREQAAKKLKAEAISDAFLGALEAVPAKLREQLIDDRVKWTSAAAAEAPKQTPPTGAPLPDAKKVAEEINW